MNFNIFFTNNCNLRCKYCYEGDKKTTSITYETLDHIIKFIQSIVPSIDNTISITTHGGEPLLAFPQIQYFVKQTKKIFPNVRFNITTNATLLTPEIIDFLTQNYNTISVSIDGTRDAHDKNRVFANSSGSYDCVIKNIKHLLKKHEQLQARMTINHSNYSFLSDGVIELIKMGFKEILPVPDIFSRNWTSEIFTALEQEFKKIIVYLKENCLESTVSISIIDHIESKTKNSLCDGGVTTFTINTDGKLYPCILVNENPNYCIGDIYNGISTEKFNHIHKWDKRKLESCKGCTRYDYCTNTRCKIINQVIEGDAMVPIVARCATENLAIHLYEFQQTYENKAN